MRGGREVGATRLGRVIMTQWIPESDIQAAGKQTAGYQPQLTGTRLAWDHRILQLIIRLLEWLQAVPLPPPCEESWQSSFCCNGGTCPPGDQGQHPELAQSNGLELELSSAHQANNDQRERAVWSGLSSDMCPEFVRHGSDGRAAEKVHEQGQSSERCVSAL